MDIKKILNSLLPFVVAGIAIALCISLLFMFFSIAIWGLLIGGILWLAAMAKHYLFAKPSVRKEDGRIIEHDDPK